MPDQECFKTIGELHAEIENLKEWKREVERREAGHLVDQRKKEEASIQAEAFKDGAIWALAKVGAVVVSALSVVGYLAVNGVPVWVKKLFIFAFGTMIK